MTKRASKRSHKVAYTLLALYLVPCSDAFAPVLKKSTAKLARNRLVVLNRSPDDNNEDVSSESSVANRVASSPDSRGRAVTEKQDAANGQSIVHGRFSSSDEEQSRMEEAPSSLPTIARPGAAWINRLLSEPLVEVTEAYLVVLSSVLVAIDTLSLTPWWHCTIEDSQDFIAYAFVVDFLVRWYATDKGIFRYLSQPLVLVDIVVVVLPVILPFIAGIPPWLTSQSGLINLRLLRILRLQRVLQDLETFSSFTYALGLGSAKEVKPYQLQLARVILSLFTLLSISAGLIYAAEKNVNQDMENYFSALYFGLTTLTTVGFGDITPVTSQGKLIVSGSILAGVTIIPAQAAALVDSLMNFQEERELDENGTDTSSSGRNNSMLPSSSVDATTPCPSCGATFHWTSASYCWSCGGPLSMNKRRLNI